MDFTTGQYKEIMKLYPKIRIPYFKEASYYLEQLKRNDKKIDQILRDFEDCFVKHGDVTHYKMSKFDDILEYLRPFQEKFSSAPLPTDIHTDYPKSFGNWNENVLYMSVDMNEANWSVFSKVAGIEKQPWEEFVTKTFDLHPVIAKSKTFRQFILGNLNPSRQQTFQKEFMVSLVRLFEFHDMKPICVSADELIFEMIPMQEYVTPKIDNLDHGTKTKIFQMIPQESYGERIIVKRNAENDHQELFSVQGTRFFIHYKNAILYDEVEDRDLYFEPEPKRLAKWIL